MIEVVPADRAAWDDLEAVLGAVKCHGDKCYCQRFTIPNRRWRAVSDAERADMLRDQVEADPPGGLVAYLDIPWGEPRVGSVGSYADAGFVEVSRPSKRRVVMRVDFPSGTPRSRG